MDPRDVRSVGPLRLVDRAFGLVAADPRRLALPVWAGSAPLVLCALAFHVVERVEHVTSLRPLFAIAFTLLVGPRTSGWAIAGRTVLFAAEGRDAPLEESRAVVRARRLAVWKAGIGLALVSMPWLFLAALLALVTPTLPILLLPFVGLRWIGAAPTLAARVGVTSDSAGGAYVRAWRDTAGSRPVAYLTDLLLWIGMLLVFVNGWVFLLFLTELAQEIFGMDLAFAEAFLSPQNGFFALALAGLAWLALEPVRATVGALLAVQGRVQNEALDLDRMVGALETARPRPALAATAAALVLLLLSAPVRADEIPVAPLPDAPVVTSAGDPQAREAVRTILAGREYQEALGTREVGFLDWIRDLWDGVWGSDEEPWDPEIDGLLPDLPMPSPWIFVGFAGAILVVAIVLLWPKRPRAAPETEAAREAEPDPRERAPEEIVDEAEALFRAGDVNGALRRLYLATLVSLDRRRLISFDPSMTNWQYLRHLPPGEPRTLFAKLCRLFDYKWYGKEPATEDDYREARALADRLLAPAEALHAA
jgi:hypothetical protein